MKRTIRFRLNPFYTCRNSYMRWYIGVLMKWSPTDTWSWTWSWSCNGSLYHSRYHEVNGDIYSAGFIILPAGSKFPTVVIPFFRLVVSPIRRLYDWRFLAMKWATITDGSYGNWSLPIHPRWCRQVTHWGSMTRNPIAELYWVRPTRSSSWAVVLGHNTECCDMGILYAVKPLPI